MSFRAAVQFSRSISSASPATATLAAPWASLGLLCTPSPETSPSSIKFSNSATEALYLSAAQPGLVAVDRTICFHKLWISSVLLVPMLTGHIQSTAMGRGLWSFYVCLLAAHMCWMWACPKTYQQQRRRVIIPLKLLLAACLTSFVPTFVLKEVDSTATYVELVLLGAGLVMQLCTGVCMPVLWRHHVPLALSMFCIYNLTMLGPLVDVFVCSPAAVQHTAALYTALEASAYTLSGLLMPYPMQRPTAASPRAQVYILVLWLQLHLALLVPSLYLYRAESRSRAAFLQQQEEQEQDQQQEQEQEEEQVGTASTDHASSSRARVQRACSRSELMPSVRTPGTLHPVVLGGAFMVLLGIVSWNLLHLGAAWLVSSLDRLGPHRFVSELASEDGWAGSCFQD